MPDHPTRCPSDSIAMEWLYMIFDKNNLVKDGIGRYDERQNRAATSRPATSLWTTSSAAKVGDNGDNRLFLSTLQS